MDQINRICYCRSALQRDETEIDFVCRNCCRKIVKATESFWCSNESCTYKAVIGQTFDVCRDCYYENANDNHNDINDESTFEFKRFMSSLNTIRLQIASSQ